MEILPNSDCRDQNIFSESRIDDICSTYSLPNKSYCEITRHNLEISTDRGSGLISKSSHLVGLLSQIIPPTSEMIGKMFCRDIDRVHAFYTLVGKHIMWIYTKLAFEVSLETNDPYYIASPYTNELQEYIVQNESIEDSIPFASTPSSTSLNQVQSETTTSTDFYVIFNFFSNSSRIASNSSLLMIALSVVLTLFYEAR